MAQNPPHLRPDLAPKARIETPRPGQPTIGMVSLGCPKALVDSERILTRLRAEGYAISPDYAGAEAVIVNTCGFLDSAKAESLEAIGEALHQNGKVIVTGCLGPIRSISPARIHAFWPSPARINMSRFWMPSMPPCRPRRILSWIFCPPPASRSRRATTAI
jgi:hypothetical protein